MSSDRYLIERLPWYLNGTLDEAEASEVEGLLAESAEVQAELAETQAAARIYGHRLPTEVLVAYAFDGEHPDVPTELLERYMAVSPLAGDELTLVRDSKADLEAQLEAEGDQPRSVDPETRFPVESQPGSQPEFQRPVAAQPSTGWRRMALAASLVGVTALSLASWQWFQVQDKESRLATVERQLQDALDRDVVGSTSEGPQAGDEALRQKIETLEQDKLQLAAGKSDLVEQIEAQNERIERLDGQVAELSRPLLNVPVVDVFPGDLVLRGEIPEERRVIVPRQTRTVTLILNSGIEDEQSVTSLHIVAADGSRVWRSTDSPERDKLGIFTVAIPVQTLDSGTYTLQLVDERDGQTQVIETYQVEIQ